MTLKVMLIEDVGVASSSLLLHALGNIREALLHSISLMVDFELCLERRQRHFKQDIRGFAA
jgi:hypothetical protein